jgi:HAE1 family hydrophobic/amphiphilic exporter-1
MSKNTSKHTLLQRFSLFFFDHWRLAAIIWVAIVSFGLLSYTTLMQRQGFPSVNLPFSTVTGVYLVNDANKVDADVTKPATSAIKQIDSVKTVNASSGANFVAIQIEYNEGTDAKAASAEVQKTIEALDLPESAKLNYQSIDFSKYANKYDMIVSVYAPDSTPADTLQAQAATVAANLQDVNNVTSAEVIAQSETARNPITGQLGTERINFDRTAITKDGATTFYKSVSVGIVSQTDADVLRLYDDIEAELATTQNDINAIITGTTAESVREQVTSLQSNLVEGLLIVAVISLLLISWRAGLATALGMATVLLATIGGIHLIGYSLNTITLFALILSLALIVDDATIAAEAIDASQKEGRSKRETVAYAIKRVARATTTGTMVTILAFSPMLFISGILGSFIKALPITIIVSLLFSLLISLSLIPFMASWLILPKTSKPKHASYNPIIRLESWLSNGLSRLIIWTSAKTARRIPMAAAAIGLSVLALVGSIYFFGKLKFDIFPPSKDGDEITITLKFAPGTTIEQAELTTDEANRKIASSLGNNGRKVAYLSAADANEAVAQVSLIPYSQRSTTAPEVQQDLTEALQGLEGAIVKVSLVGAGGPPNDQPFKVNVISDDPAEAQTLAKNIAEYLKTATITRPNGTTATFTNPTVAGIVTVDRADGERIVSVSAGFSADDTSALVNAGQSAVEAQFADQKDNLQFDFGNEANNQDSFASMLLAFPVLIAVMFVLLAIQFRSLLQPVLILFAIPFSFLGVAIGLFVTNNALSFFVMIGFFALIGIAVNNSIMLIDYANQARREGKGYAQSIASALRHRFRPLLTTSLISFVALAPLALNDPFWQALAVTIMFGIITSTFLIITVLPYYWLITEWFRLGARKIWRRIRRTKR